MFHLIGVIIFVLGVSRVVPLAHQRWRDGRIVGGHEISIEEAPHQVSLVSRGRGHSCGGAILSSRIIITAAHCVRGSSAESFQVRVGSTSVSGGGELLNVSRLAWHDDFTSWDMSHDVALLLLARELVYSGVVAPVEMLREPVNDGEVASVTGWGTTEEGGKRSETLQEVLVPIVNQEACREAYRAFYDITPSMMCAGVAAGGKDACQGDSGGPLTVGGKLAGLVSWGAGCARPGYPGVYTRLAALQTWIESTITKLEQDIDNKKTA